jgi:hypothetical protein
MSVDSTKNEMSAGWKIFVQIITVVGLLGGVWAAKELIDDEINKTVDSRLSDEIVLRKIAAQTRPSLIFNGSGSILHDMGAAQYLKPDDIEITEHINDQGIIMPTKLHIGFVKPVSFPPIVTPLYDTASLTAVNGKGLDWDFLINWTVVPDKTNDEARVYRLEIVP